jgi:hypothetical protein
MNPNSSCRSCDKRNYSSHYPQPHDMNGPSLVAPCVVILALPPESRAPSPPAHHRRPAGAASAADDKPRSLAATALAPTDESPLSRHVPRLHGGSPCRPGPTVDLATRGSPSVDCLSLQQDLHGGSLGPPQVATAG